MHWETQQSGKQLCLVCSRESLPRPLSGFLHYYLTHPDHSPCSQIEFTVEKKADATYKIVGAASIAAKVTRDRLVEFWLHPEGSTLPACCKRPAHAGGSSSMAAKKRKKAICSASGSKKAKVEEEAAEEAAVEREREDDEEVAMIAEEIEERGSGYPGGELSAHSCLKSLCGH